MNELTKEQKQGKFGETFVKQYFENEGLTVIKNSNPFDMKGDLIVENIVCEVKTQTPFYLYRHPRTQEVFPAFTVPITTNNGVSSNQLSKIMNADRLFFLGIPTSKNNYNIALFEAPKPGERYFTTSVNGKDGRLVCAFRIFKKGEEEGLTHIATYDATKFKNKIESFRTTSFKSVKELW